MLALARALDTPKGWDASFDVDNTGLLVIRNSGTGASVWHRKYCGFPLWQPIPPVSAMPDAIHAVDFRAFRDIVMLVEVPNDVAKKLWDEAYKYSIEHPHHNGRIRNNHYLYVGNEVECILDMHSTALAYHKQKIIEYQVAITINRADEDQIAVPEGTPNYLAQLILISAQFTTSMHRTKGKCPIRAYSWDEGGNFVLSLWKPPVSNRSTRSRHMLPPPPPSPSAFMSPGSSRYDSDRRPARDVLEIIGQTDEDQTEGIKALIALHDRNRGPRSKTGDNADYSCLYLNQPYNPDCDCIWVRHGRGEVTVGDGPSSEFSYCYFSDSVYLKELQRILDKINQEFSMESMPITIPMVYNAGAAPSNMVERNRFAMIRRRVFINVVKQLTIRCNCNRPLCRFQILGLSAPELQGFECDHYKFGPKAEHNRNLAKSHPDYWFEISQIEFKEGSILCKQLRDGGIRIVISAHHPRGLLGQQEL